MYQASQRIADLREQGWKVKVRIERIIGFKDEVNYDPILGPEPILVSRGDGATGHEFKPVGGQTKVELLPPGASEPWVGLSRCHTRLDNFNKKIGLEIAFGRAWKAYETGAVAKVA